MDQEFSKKSGQEWLSNLFKDKVKSNPSFSLRSFARQLEISPAVLSRIFKGERTLTFKLAVRVAEALNLENGEREKLYSFYIPANKCSNLEFNEEEDQYHALKDWYHYAITQMLMIKNFDEDYRWMARMLGINEFETKEAIARLIRLKILERDANDQLALKKSYFDASPNVASLGIKHFKNQILEKTKMTLDEPHHFFSSMTIAINEEKISEAKKEIKKFKTNMKNILGEGSKTRIYNLGIHFIPLSQSSNEIERFDQ